MLSIGYPDGTSSVRSYDVENRIASVVNDNPQDNGYTPHITISYVYDNNGNCLAFKKILPILTVLTINSPGG